MRYLQGVPQIIAIVSLSRDGKASLKKAVREHLGSGSTPLYLDVQEEVRLTPHPSVSTTPVEVQGRRIRLPQMILATLELEAGSLLAMIQREGAVALKKLAVEEREGDTPQVIDCETPHEVTRIAEAIPMPGRLLPALQERHRALQLKHDVRGFLRERPVFDAWRARKLLDVAESADEPLRRKWIQERLDAQGEDGSWNGQVGLTARNVRELHELALPPEADAVQQGVEWLLSRPQSPWNPGMFFGTDGLVEQQLEIVEQRNQGQGGRFCEIRASEQNLVRAGDEIICNPCGPRIMWPNGLVLETLLALGYEEHPRVQAALRTMLTNDWCECSYQHGLSSWRRKEPLDAHEIARFEASCIAEYRYGGITSVEELSHMDLSRTSGTNLLRAARRAGDGVDVYILQMPDHIQGCEMITTRAMSQVRDPLMRRFAEAHLWRFASRQHSVDGAFAPERYGGGLHEAGLLEVFARYDHPVSKVAIMRALPWVVDAQHDDGSWGAGSHRDASTLAILKTLRSVGDLLPPGLIP